MSARQLSVGDTVGQTVVGEGKLVGSDTGVGLPLGVLVGPGVWISDNSSDGGVVGDLVGAEDGVVVGGDVGIRVGSEVGANVGDTVVGCIEGIVVGGSSSEVIEGIIEGIIEGTNDGHSEGLSDSSSDTGDAFGGLECTPVDGTACFSAGMLVGERVKKSIGGGVHFGVG